MITQEEILERVLSRVSDKVAEAVKETVTEAVQRELSSTMTKVMVESEFLRQVNDEMRLGLKGIYQEIASASLDEEAADTSRTQKLFKDATRQIEEIMQTTLEATEKIMTTVERLLDQQSQARALLDGLTEKNETTERLAALNTELEASLTDIITDLSFQDLTGQRLKKVVSAISSIRETVFDLYVSTGLMLKSQEEAPEKDIAEIAEESRRKVAEIRNSELKGPSMDSSQKDVDDLLASLGL